MKNKWGADGLREEPPKDEKETVQEKNKETG